jgi:hypothetical protein
MALAADDGADFIIIDTGFMQRVVKREVLPIGIFRSMLTWL